MNKNPCVYILTNCKNEALYIGVTFDLEKCIWQHKQKVINGFSKKHALDRLIYYERHKTMELATTREKQLKKWNRDWKIKLINNMNRQWRDLSEELI